MKRGLLAMCKKQELSIVNKDICCDGKWTRIDKNGKKSILEYIITMKEDASGNTRMTIDEEKEYTPSHLNQEKELIYSDHCMMTLETNILIEKKKEEGRKYITEEGYKNYEKRLKEKQVSGMIREENFELAYKR